MWQNSFKLRELESSTCFDRLFILWQMSSLGVLSLCASRNTEGYLSALTSRINFILAMFASGLPRRHMSLKCNVVFMLAWFCKISIHFKLLRGALVARIWLFLKENENSCVFFSLFFFQEKARGPAPRTPRIR